MKKNLKVGYLGPKFKAFEKKNSKCVMFSKSVATHLSYRVTFLYKNSILHDEQVKLSDNWCREWVALAYLWFVLTFSSVTWGLYVKNLTDKIVEIEKTHISTDFESTGKLSLFEISHWTYLKIDDLSYVGCVLNSGPQYHATILKLLFITLHHS